MIPPALVADIGGGTMPAVINILLGLRQRDATGEGVYLDVAMTDAMFTFAWYAYAIGHATGKFPAPGELRLVGGSPRYQLYPTRDGKIVACGALEQKFWLAFCNTIGLPAPLMNDLADPSDRPSRRSPASPRDAARARPAPPGPRTRGRRRSAGGEGSPGSSSPQLESATAASTKRKAKSTQRG